MRSVLIALDVETESGNRILRREVQIIGSPGLELDVEPASVDVLISGPVPLLNEIEESPELVQVAVEAAELTALEPGETISVTPTVIAPPDVAVQILPQSVQITARERP